MGRLASRRGQKLERRKIKLIKLKLLSEYKNLLYGLFGIDESILEIYYLFCIKSKNIAS